MITPSGYLTITDRAKVDNKSGGEWISSVQLENHLMAHPDVLEAAVVGVPDVRWDERPLACVVVRPAASVAVDDLRAFIAARVAKWQGTERWDLLAQAAATSR